MTVLDIFVAERAPHENLRRRRGEKIISAHDFSYPHRGVIDDDGEVEDILTVVIGLEEMDDEDAAMERDDLISAVLDTLRVND